MGLRRRLSSELNGNIQERKEIINLASVSRQKKKKIPTRLYIVGDRHCGRIRSPKSTSRADFPGGSHIHCLTAEHRSVRINQI